MKTNPSSLIKEEQQILQAIFQVLQNIWHQKSSSFSGLGIILYKSLDGIPVFPLRDSYNQLMLPAYGWSNIERKILD
ncbi:hypothetical protein [Calothrix rhizosoleniae]|uniref:hypothetical protein n=1 Tax=Calothrix rhizosoleniae TaxID=888997 RepID=UPI000B49B84B|nr:hypothetical protein [Calothrix rhizosoleniae]